MKTTIFTLCAMVGAISSSAQELKEKDVPANIKETFAKTYPDIKKAEWEKEGSNFEAEYEVRGKEVSVLFDVNGNILETEIEIPESELPAAAIDYVSQNYKGAKIKEASRITASDGKISYEADVDNKDLLFDSTGKFLKTDGKENEKDHDK